MNIYHSTALLLATASVTAHATRPAEHVPKARAVHSLDELAQETSSVVEGDVVSIEHTYSEEDGPRIVATLERIKTHFGTHPGERIQLRIHGGPLPGGYFMLVSELPRLMPGKRYVLFLRNSAWSLSPIVTKHAYSVETIGRKEVLVDPDGNLVEGIADEGVRVGEKRLFNTSVAGRVIGQSPALLPGITEDDAASGLDRTGLLGALKAAWARTKRSPQGQFFDEPSASWSWKRHINQ